MFDIVYSKHLDIWIFLSLYIGVIVSGEDAGASLELLLWDDSR